MKKSQYWLNLDLYKRTKHNIRF